MSHFSVMVIGDNVEEQLRPFHEFECTGIDDQYVQDIDRTEEARQYYDKDTTTCLRAADGSLHSFFDENGEWRPEFSQPDPSQPGKNSRTYHVPDGYEQVEAPTSHFESFADFMRGYYGWECVPHGEAPDLKGAHKYGYVLLDKSGNVVKCVDRTNHNKKWDWWVMGGRWSGFLKLKQGATGLLGEKSWLHRNEPDEMDRCDQARKGDIDFEGMRNRAAAKAADAWDVAAAAHGGQAWEPWSSVGPRLNYSNEARLFYREQPAIKALRAVFDNPLSSVDKFLQPRDAYIQAARDGACATFAVLKGGQWYEKGSMGWWGVVSDEKDQAEWNRQFSELIDSLPNDTLITIVDCHV